MSATVVFVLLGAIALLIQYVLWFTLLKLGASWAGIEGATTARALLAVLLIFVVQIAVSAASLVLESAPPLIQILNAPGWIAAGLLSPLLLIWLLFRTSWRKALLAWLPTLLVPVAGVLLVYLVVRPFLFEAFKTPTNTMAPTLMGNHFTVKCPTCGEPAYGSPPPRGARDIVCQAICSKFHVHAAKPGTTTSEGDRFIAAKYLLPRRWDIIVFRYPADPSVNYVKRLVGLPGETVYIKDGAVWINGQKLDPPTPLKGLNYVTELPHMPPLMRVAGTVDFPAVLGPDEYFVLGDFSLQSSDSRVWEKGAPGHPAYAVPGSYIIGVVTHIYWPPSRWRILR